MALLVLFSTVSFTVDKHFCGDILVDASVFSEVKKCQMAAHKSADAENSVKKNSCCKDEKVIVEGQEELKLNFQDLNFEQQLFLSSFTYSYIDLFEGLPQQVIPFQYYSPPILVSDIQLLDQVFLIWFLMI